MSTAPEQAAIQQPAVVEQTQVKPPVDPQPEEAARNPIMNLLIGNRGIEIKTFQDLWQLATCIVKSGIAPKGMDTAYKVSVAIQYGLELGLPPMLAGQNIAVINNRPTVWGDIQLGLCRASKFWDEEAFDEVEFGKYPDDDWGCSCTVRRRGATKCVTRTFTMAQAKRAGLNTKDTYRKYMERMILHRARSFALRDCYADVLMGLYAREEFIDVDQLMDSLDLSAVVETEDTPAKPEPKKRRTRKKIEPPAGPDGGDQHPSATPPPPVAPVTKAEKISQKLEAQKEAAEADAPPMTPSEQFDFDAEADAAPGGPLEALEADPDFDVGPDLGRPAEPVGRVRMLCQKMTPAQRKRFFRRAQLKDLTEITELDEESLGDVVALALAIVKPKHWRE